MAGNEATQEVFEENSLAASPILPTSENRRPTGSVPVAATYRVARPPEGEPAGAPETVVRAKTSAELGDARFDAPNGRELVAGIELEVVLPVLSGVAVTGVPR